MSTTLFRTGLRFVFSNKLFEKRITCICATIPREQNVRQRNCKLQANEISIRMYSNKRVHRTAISTTFEHEQKENGSDSDSDQELGESQFWRRKMRTLHSHLDVNKDGVISYDDFMLLGERFSCLGHLTPEAKIEFIKVLNELWKEQWGEVNPYNLICIEKYLKEMQHVLNDVSLQKKCHHFLPFLFKAVDKDQSGEISVQEFKLFFQCLGLTNDDAVISFNHIDTNEDGKISFKEFVSLGRDFFLTEDPRKPSKYFWGPLVD